MTFEGIRRDVNRFVTQDGDSYLSAYPEFLAYFAAIDRIERRHLIIGAHFVYGWMPTILTLNLANETAVLQYLNAAKSGQLLTVDQLEVVKMAVNNSLVGASKLLHFINPCQYAIWDSRIFRYATGKKSQYGIGKVETYLEYLDRINRITVHPEFRNIHISIEAHLQYRMTPMRVVEIVMFEADRNR